MKLEVPIKVDIDDVTKLIHDLQCLQTYKLGANDTTVLVSLDEVVSVFSDHVMAKRIDKDIDVPTKWIPVSERLPSKYGEYFVSVKWFDGTYDVSVYEYTGYNEWNDGDMCGQTVTAWMPLPEPYKEGE